MAHVEYIIRQGVGSDGNGNPQPRYYVVKLMINDEGKVYHDETWTRGYKSRAAAERKARQLGGDRAMGRHYVYRLYVTRSARVVKTFLGNDRNEMLERYETWVIKQGIPRQELELVFDHVQHANN